MYKRLLDLPALLSHKSFFLLGPRQTGKSTLLRASLPEAVFVDLLESETFHELSSHPERLRQRHPDRRSCLVIDEIQKLPILLNEVQLMLDRNPSLRVVMTGSSARKLRRGAANLLGGRAWMAALNPLVSAETAGVPLSQRLNRGGLPSILNSQRPLEDLRAYVGAYLREEIRAEGLIRSIENFSRFLDVAGMTSGEQVNYTAVANDAGVPARTVREHYQVLVDTLVGHLLPAYQKTLKRKPVAMAKFYLFDVGIANVLKHIESHSPGSASFGQALEHQVFLELRSFLDYRRLTVPLTYWRSQSQFEVDFVVGDAVAVEVKAKASVTERDLKGLRALREEVKLKHSLVVCLERSRRKTEDGIVLLPVQEFFKGLWEGEWLS